MPEFATPQPISVTVDLFLGHVEVIASDRADTVVDVRPTDPSNKEHVRAAKETEVSFAAGHLTVKSPRGWRVYALGANPSIDVTIQLPAGSRLHGTAHMGSFVAAGELGQCELKTSLGDLQLEKAGPVELRTSAGNITVDEVAGRASITTSSGSVRVRQVSGSATVKNSNGNTLIGEVTGDLQVNAANGTVSVDRPRGSVTAKSANGSIRVGDADRGTLRLETSLGELEIGIHPGRSAYLDVSAEYGSLQNLMEASGEPAPGEESLHVYARSAYGNIIIRSATPVA